jgi:hypothetical protein
VGQALQITGALLILAAFVLAQLQRLDPHSLVYLWLNALGSAVLAWLALDGHQWGFLLLEGVWALVSAWGILKKVRGSANASP